MIIYTVGNNSYRLLSTNKVKELHFNSISIPGNNLVYIERAHIYGTIMGDKIYKDPKIKTSLDFSKLTKEDEILIKQLITGLFDYGL